ncbi:hypothetical protein [Streptomyces sp. LN699]
MPRGSLDVTTADVPRFGEFGGVLGALQGLVVKERGRGRRRP